MKLKALIPIFALIAVLSGCYADNFEDRLGEEPGTCDDPDDMWMTEIKPWVDNKCTGCHSGSFPQGGVSLSTYEEVSAAAQLVHDVISLPESDPGSMPKDAPNLDACKIEGFDKWIDLGTPRN